MTRTSFNLSCRAFLPTQIPALRAPIRRRAQVVATCGTMPRLRAKTRSISPVNPDRREWKKRTAGNHQPNCNCRLVNNVVRHSHRRVFDVRDSETVQGKCLELIRRPRSIPSPDIHRRREISVHSRAVNIRTPCTEPSATAHGFPIPPRTDIVTERPHSSHHPQQNSCESTARSSPGKARSKQRRGCRAVAFAPAYSIGCARTVILGMLRMAFTISAAQRTMEHGSPRQRDGPLFGNRRWDRSAPLAGSAQCGKLKSPKQSHRRRELA